MDTMQVPAGYKVTELGLLPEGWKAAPFGHFAAPNKAKYNPLRSSQTVHCVELEHIEQGIGALNGYTNSLDQKSLKSVFKKGDVLFGKLRPYLKKYYLADFEGVCSTEIWPLENTPLTNSQFLYYVVQSDSFIDAANNTTGTKMPRASWPDMAKALFPLPPLAEQQAIAEALGEMDALLAAQRARLAKQRAVKEWLLKSLMTGKKRLPGFENEWEKKLLRELANIQRGASPRPIDSPVWFDTSSHVGWVRISDVTASNGKELTQTTNYLSAKGIAASRFLPTGSLIMSICATVGIPVITAFDTCIHDGFVGFTDLRSVDKVFLYYTLKHLEKEFKSQGQTGSQSNINSDIVRNYPIDVPELDEQRAIAAVLSEADAYLAALEAEHAKTQLLKQGMMQNLLTGKLRLV